LVLDDADDDGLFSNTSAYAEKNLLFVFVSESSPLSVVFVVLVLVVVLSPLETPSPLLAKVPKRFLISFPSSSSSHREDDFPTPPPP